MILFCLLQNLFMSLWVDQNYSSRQYQDFFNSIHIDFNPGNIMSIFHSISPSIWTILSDTGNELQVNMVMKNDIRYAFCTSLKTYYFHVKCFPCPLNTCLSCKTNYRALYIHITSLILASLAMRKIEDFLPIFHNNNVC